MYLLSLYNLTNRKTKQYFLTFKFYFIMNNMNEKLAKFSIEKLEERKEFTFYCTPKPCSPNNGGGNTGGGNNGGGA